MFNSPIVSICIPAYNGENHIQEAIWSVLNQTEKRFELIVIDDCSTDNTVAKVLEIKDPRIKLIQNPVNVGFENNWNNALNEARLPYFKLMPQDDLLDRLCLETQINAFEKVKEPIALVCCARNIINCKGKKLLKRGMKGTATGFLTAGSAIKKIVRSGGNPIGEPGAVIMKLETAKEIGQFSKGKIYTIDLDYWIRALQFGGLYYIDQPLASFRVHQGSQSVSMTKLQSLQYRHLLINIKEKFPAVSSLDLLIGNFKSKINEYLRLFFYKVYA